MGGRGIRIRLLMRCRASRRNSRFPPTLKASLQRDPLLLDPNASYEFAPYRLTYRRTLKTFTFLKCTDLVEPRTNQGTSANFHPDRRLHQRTFPSSRVKRGQLLSQLGVLIRRLVIIFFKAVMMMMILDLAVNLECGWLHVHPSS